MHLSRGYPWELKLSDRELSIIETCLEIADVAGEELTLAEHVLTKIRENRAKLSSPKRATKHVIAAQLNSTDDEESSEED